MAIRQTLRSLIPGLGRCRQGAVMIETALVAPVLVLLAVGGFEVSRMIARQLELQSGALEGQQIALAANLGASTDIDEVESLLMHSLQLADDKVTVEKLYRCDADTSLVSEGSSCAEGSVVSSYIRISLTDSYQPIWTRLGIGSAFNYNIIRLVQLS